jgi:hypothetical protein
VDERVTFKLRPAAEAIEAIEALVGNRKYGKAAFAARSVAADASAEDLKKIVAVLADALAELGDRHSGKGRPKKDAWDEQNWRLSARVRFARGNYTLAVIARDLVDDHIVGADDLAWFLFRLGFKPEGVPEGLLIDEELTQSAEMISRNVSECREAVLPHAEAFLREFRLGPKNVPRKGFKTFAAERIAEKAKLRIDQVRPKRRK